MPNDQLQPTPGQAAYDAYRKVQRRREPFLRAWSDPLFGNDHRAAWEAAAQAVQSPVHAFLKCDSCGQYHEDNHANLSESCECSRFLQRTEWATLADLRKDRAEAATAVTLRTALELAVIELDIESRSITPLSPVFAIRKPRLDAALQQAREALSGTQPSK